MSEEALAKAEAALTDWWYEQSNTEILAVVPKAVEYGSQDLMEIGRVMASIMGMPNPTDEEANEIGIFFYLQGKLARWTAAMRAGTRVSDDTLLDLGIYVKMAQRNRAVGGWPFAYMEGDES